jgi:hypothetical protein
MANEQFKWSADYAEGRGAGFAGGADLREMGAWQQAGYEGPQITQITQITQIMDAFVLCNLRTCGKWPQNWQNGQSVICVAIWRNLRNLRTIVKADTNGPQITWIMGKRVIRSKFAVRQL